MNKKSGRDKTSKHERNSAILDPGPIVKKQTF